MILSCLSVALRPPRFARIGTAKKMARPGKLNNGDFRNEAQKCSDASGKTLPRDQSFEIANLTVTPLRRTGVADNSPKAPAFEQNSPQPQTSPTTIGADSHIAIWSADMIWRF
ncbi:MAG TPA: hypothetical protein VEH76_11585 [Methylocystis sp.]|nr:hypothetical protein [Methylocystis sp.]